MPTILEWVKKLEAQIDEQKKYAAPWENRYDNKFALPFIAREYREVYGDKLDAMAMIDTILEAPKTGTAAITIDALVERLTIVGTTSEDPATAAAIRDGWDENALGVMHHEAHREAVLRSRSFGWISRSSDGRRGIVTIESSEQCAAHRMLAPPYDVDAFMKILRDEWTGVWTAKLLLANPLGGYQEIDLRQGDKVVKDPQGSGIQSRWAVTSEVSRTGPLPVVEFTHRARLLKPPMSEIEPIYTLVDLADLIEGLMVFAGHFGAVPIRWGTGIDIARDPKDPNKPLLGPDGKPAMGFKPRADHFWFTSNEKGNFGQMVPASLDTYVSWAQWTRSLLRSKTKIASTYYAFDLKSHMTAELLKTDEAPMVRLIRSLGQHGTFDYSWRRLLTMLAQHEGHSGRAEPVWDDPQTRMEAQAVDAFQKAVASGLGVVESAVRFLGWTRDDAERAREEAVEEARQQLEANDPTSLLDPITRARLKVVQPDAGPNQPASA